MKFLSCFSGIEAASVAWLPLGWQCVGVAEMDKFPCAVLEHHYPDVPNLGDVTAADFLERAARLKPDVLVGGPPCQDFSIAGLRAGLQGERGNLTLRWVEIINAVRPLVVVTENVPGWFSVNGGHAFGAFLGALVGADTALVPPPQCGGRWTDAGMVAGPERRAAWRVLDAQYFGLAQRRERVFVVASARDGLDPAAVLFERTGVQRNHPPRREAGEGVAPTIASRSTAGGGLGTDFDCDGGLIAKTLHGAGFDASEDGTGCGTPLIVPPLTGNPYGDHVSREGLLVLASGQANAEVSRDVSTSLTCLHEAPIVAFDARQSSVVEYGPIAGPLDTHRHSIGVLSFDPTQITSRTNRNNPKPGAPSHTLAAGAHPPCVAFGTKDYGQDAQVDLAPTLRAMNEVDGHANGGGQVAVAQASMRVRRLTPTECARLQGFRDDYLDITYRGKPAADGNRYKALGNSMAVPVVRWLGQRIQAAVGKSCSPAKPAK